MVLHINFGSERLYEIVERTNCRKFLNAIPFMNPLIGNKKYQQEQIAKSHPSFIIETFTKENLNSIKDSSFIAKPAESSCGQGIFLINDVSLCDNAPNNYIYQRYIKNDGDWRVIVIGGKAVSAIKRLGKIGQATNNIATGNFAIKETNKSILENINDIAEKSAKTMGFDYVGIDIIKDLDTNKYYFLESNERPTFETSQILTGINIAQKIILELIK
jgi:glutathione synthase/RimK-type ligase-like ATP-grasp enzyme